MLRHRKQRTARRAPARTSELSQALLHAPCHCIQSFEVHAFWSALKSQLLSKDMKEALADWRAVVLLPGLNILCLMAGTQQHHPSRRCLTRQWRARGLLAERWRRTEASHHTGVTCLQRAHVCDLAELSYRMGMLVAIWIEIFRLGATPLA